MFLPAPFELFEFGDDEPENASEARRFLLHANGLVTEPAEQVLLAWIGSPRNQIVTATRRYAGPFSLQETGRSDAILLAGSHAPDNVAPPLLALEVWSAMQSTAGKDDPRWAPSPVVIDGSTTQAEVIDTGAGTFGWASYKYDDRLVAFASHGISAGDIRLRTLTPDSATRYPCNPLTPRTWREFVDCQTHR